jgi:hypothetical protein
MKKIPIHIALLMVGFWLTACKKELPQLPNSPNPIFVAHGTIDGQQVSMKAGLDNYVMSSEEWAWNDVPVYRGTITDGVSFFQLDWYSGNVWNLSTDLQQLLNQSNLSCAALPSIPLVLNASSCAEPSAFSNFFFRLNNGNSQAAITFNQPGAWEVVCEAQQTNGLETVLANKVIVGYDSKSLFLLNAQQIGNLLSVNVSNNTEDIDSVNWVMGNFNVTTSLSSAQIPINTGSNVLKVNVYFSNGIVRQRQIAVGVGDREPITDFVYALESSWFSLFDWKVGLVIKIGGETYETNHITQEQPVQIIVKSKSLYTDPTTHKEVLKMDYDVIAKFLKVSNGLIVTGEFSVSMALPIP